MDDPTIMGWELMNEPRCEVDSSSTTVNVSPTISLYLLRHPFVFNYGLSNINYINLYFWSTRFELDLFFVSFLKFQN